MTPPYHNCLFPFYPVQPTCSHSVHLSYLLSLSLPPSLSLSLALSRSVNTLFPELPQEKKRHLSLYHLSPFIPSSLIPSSLSSSLSFHTYSCFFTMSSKNPPTSPPLSDETPSRTRKPSVPDDVVAMLLGGRSGSGSDLNKLTKSKKNKSDSGEEKEVGNGGGSVEFLHRNQQTSSSPSLSLSSTSSSDPHSHPSSNKNNHTYVSPERVFNQQKSLEDSIKRDKKVEMLKKEWLSVLSSWNSSSRTTKKVKKLCWEGIPPSLRGIAWSKIIGNKLHITPELFEINRERARQIRLRQSLSDETKRGEETINRESSLRLIEIDIPRTFPHLQIFHEGGPLFESLRDVLQTYVCYRPDVGYVQGMSFIASMFVLNMDSLSSFISLSNILNEDMYFDIYRLDNQTMGKYLSVFSSLLSKQIPKLFRHFKLVGVEPTMYVLSWLLTTFSRTLSLDISHRIYDNYLLEGPVFLFRVSFSILKCLEKELLEADMAGCLELLGRETERVEEEVLFENIRNVKITQKQFESMCEEFTA